LFESRSGSGGDGSAMGTITFANNYIHDSNGSVVFRGLSTDRTDIVNVYGNIWENIGGANGEMGQHWAGLEVNRSQVVNIFTNDASNVLEGQWGEGQGFQLWDIDTLSFYRNNVTNNFEGIFVWGGGGSFSIPGGWLRYNNISGNTEYGVKVDSAATGGPLDAALNWWGSLNGPVADNDGDGTPEYDGGGDKTIGNIIYSPWLGIAPDGNPTLPGVQITAPMLIIVAPVGPEPAGGYLNMAIQGSNELPFTDTIEVRHGTYDVSEPITDPVNIISETGSAAHTTLNGPLVFDSEGVVVGLPLKGFTLMGNVDVRVPVLDASTIHINWNDIYGSMVNNGGGTLDAEFNYWGTQEETVIVARITGAVDFDPFLPKNADDSYVDVVSILESGLAFDHYDAVARLWDAILFYGGDVGSYIANILHEAGDGPPPPVDPAANLQVAITLDGEAAGGGGGLGDGVPPVVIAGEPITGSFALTDPVTGLPINDAIVTVSLIGTNPDGSKAFAGFAIASYDELTGEYTFEIDTEGLAPGTYEIIFQTNAGQVVTLEVEIT